MLTLSKEGTYQDNNGDDVVNVGDSVIYTFTVTNTGNVTIDNITIDDATLGITGLVVVPSTLAPTESGTVNV